MGLNEIIKIGENIKLYRKKINLTQAEMAENLRIPRSTYAHYENNTREPNKDTISKIAELLGVSVNNLMGYESIGSKIRENRESKNMSPNELANKTGLSEELIKNYENDKQIPEAKVLQNIARVLNVQTKTLLPNVPLPNRPTPTYVNDEGNIVQFIYNKEATEAKLEGFDDAQLIAEYIARKANSKGYLVQNYSKIIDDVDNCIYGDIAQEIIKRGTRID